MALLELKNITKKFDSLKAVDNLSLTVKDGEMLALLGESGCGKTTTLRMIAGFSKPNSGSVLIDGNEVNNIPAYKRNVGIFFQNYALFPHMTSFENIAYGLKIKKQSKAEIKENVNKMMDLVGLKGLEKRYPRQLSGGQQQRVALARSLVVRPSILLLDEPLSNLDAKLRISMQNEIKRIQKLLNITTIIVTHDQQEAISLADKVIVMKNGRIIQESNPHDVYNKPINAFVADFMGFENFIPAKVKKIGEEFAEIEVNTLAKTIIVKKDQCYSVIAGDSVQMGIRPQKIQIVDQNVDNAFIGTVGSVIYKGDYYRVEINGIFDGPLVVNINEFKLKSGDTTGVWLPTDEIRIYKSI